MRIGLHALGIGNGAVASVIQAVALGAERAGFATLWAGEHVVMVDRPRSRYPYADDGRIAVSPDADWLDPFSTLTYAAAVTSGIRLGTGVLLLAQHQPVVVAKQAASLDSLSGGRLALGVGIGWSSEEFAALGVPFAGRGRRLEQYVAAMRTLWREDVATFEGDLVRFDSVRSYPKPVRDRTIPVILGGNSAGALDRVARIGDGWYGFNLGRDEVRERLAVLTSACRRLDRPREDIDVAVSLRDGDPEDLGELTDIGVDELVIVEPPPADPNDASAWVDELARRWGCTRPD